MNKPGYLLSYDSPNEYGLFSSGASQSRSTGKSKGRRVSVAPFAVPRRTKRRVKYSMLAQARIDEMKNIDIRTVDRDALPDMSNFKFDNTLSQEERAKRIYEASSNPYLFRLGDTVVKVEFAENGLPLQDLMGALLLRKKSGL